MAEPTPPQQPAQSDQRRASWFQGLSARLLLLTVFLVGLANLFVLPPNLAAIEARWLYDRLRAAELASLVEETAPRGYVTERVRNRLLSSAGIVSVALQVRNERRLILQAPSLARAPYLLDMRQADPSWIDPFQILAEPEDRMVRVMAKPRFREAEFVEFVAPDAPLKRELLSQLKRLLAIGLLTSVTAGLVVYLSLNLLLVRPMRRITLSMERFRANPADPKANLPLSGRRDEIGRAETELGRMQADLRAALASRARLAALGEAVAKINHDLRNMLTGAQLASERLAQSGDPKVAQALPRLESALNRAIVLASNVLAFGRAEEPLPAKRMLPLRDAVEMAADDAGLIPTRVRLDNQIDPSLQALADPDQLHRILLNLLRNAREAIEAASGRDAQGLVTVSVSTDARSQRIRITDNGPGLPQRARENLFQPFAGSTRRGGAGLGLAIARELARGHGGDLTLFDSGPVGTTFDVTLPTGDAPAVTT